MQAHRFASALTDLGEQTIEIGMPVEMMTRKVRQDGNNEGILVSEYIFRPTVRA